ncbi:MAG TPA: c-type cytochrome [Hyphomicrobiaceae bacterium]
MANSRQCSALPTCGESARNAAPRRGLRGPAAAALGATVMMAAAGAVAAQDAAAGRQKALQCQACHGLDGLAKIPGAPHLAGQVQEYLVAAMRDYRSGARKNEMMTVVMHQLTDDDMDDLAAYYAGLEPKTKAER